MTVHNPETGWKTCGASARGERCLQPYHLLEVLSDRAPKWRRFLQNDAERHQPDRPAAVSRFRRLRVADRPAAGRGIPRTGGVFFRPGNLLHREPASLPKEGTPAKSRVHTPGDPRISRLPSGLAARSGPTGRNATTLPNGNHSSQPATGCESALRQSRPEWRVLFRYKVTGRLDLVS